MRILFTVEVVGLDANAFMIVAVRIESQEIVYVT
jgi:hypothetical protein